MSDEGMCLDEAEMTDCVSRTERSSDVSVASLTTASSKHHRSRARINVTSLVNKTDKMQICTWRMSVGKEARREPIYRRTRRYRDLALVQGC